LDCDALQPATAPRLAAAGHVSVCTGRKCCAQGANETLAAARAAAAGSGVEVAPSKCMGKCGRGPCVRVRVEGREGSALTKGVSAAAAEVLLRQQFGVEC
jgi:NADH:ubiquinone oxidoreductase subunit E